MGKLVLNGVEHIAEFNMQHRIVHEEQIGYVFRCLDMPATLKAHVQELGTAGRFTVKYFDADEEEIIEHAQIAYFGGLNIFVTIYEDELEGEHNDQQ